MDKSGWKKQFGLIGFKSFPIIAFQLLKFLPLIEDYQLILVPSKKFISSIEAHYKTNRDGSLKENVIGFVNCGSKNSRYSIIINELNDEKLILLNTLNTRESALHFLILYFNNFLEESKRIPAVDRKGVVIIGTYLVQALNRYNRKFGINFVNCDDYLQSLTLHMFVKLRTNYIESLILKKLSQQQEFNGEIASFISYKMDLIFSLANPLKINSLLDAINLWGIQTDAFSLVAALSDKRPLFFSAKNKFERENNLILEKLRRNTELKRLYGEHSKQLQHQHYSGLNQYLKATGASLVSFLDKLDPEYVWLEEAAIFCKAAKWYRDRISEIYLLYHPEFGTIHNFIELLSNIFHKKQDAPKIYPEVSILSGYTLVMLLEDLIRLDQNPTYIKTALSIGQSLSDLIEKSHKEIKKKNPKSPFTDYNQAAFVLLGLVKVCISVQKYKTAIELLNRAKEIAKRHNLVEILAQVHWLKFLFCNDYEELLQGYKVFPHLKGDAYEIARAKMKTLLAAGVFEEKKKFQHYTTAIALSTNLPLEENRMNCLDDLFTERLTYYLLNLFLYVERAAKQDSLKKISTELREAKPYATTLESETSSPEAAENIFSWKTLLLLNLVDDNKNKAREHIHKIQGSPFKSVTNEQFLNKTQKAIQLFDNLETSQTMDALDLSFENRDPWSRLLQKIIGLNFKTFLKKKVEILFKSYTVC
jgi:hypothetical protein